jgi:hypothetical protein
MAKVWKLGYLSNPEKWKKRSRDWSTNNPEKRKRIQRNTDLQNLYGITTAEFESQKNKQEGRCAICMDPLMAGKNGAHVDHDHQTGKTREILCAPCNKGLGQFRDSIPRLSAAVMYLQKHSS